MWVKIRECAFVDSVIENPPSDGTALVLLCTVLFQERAGKALTHTISPVWQGTILKTIEKADGWVRYRVARAALR